MSTALERARYALQSESAQLIGMFRNTLTFTITFSVVQSIVDTRVEIVPILLPTALITVMACLMAQSHLDDVATAYAKINRQQMATIALAGKSAISSLSSVAVQFVSNLVALGLSEVITNSKSYAWVAWFVIIAVGMLYVATDALSNTSNIEN